jgi:hypothetical protein
MIIIFHSYRVILFMVAIWQTRFGGGGSDGGDPKPVVAAAVAVAVACAPGKAFLPFESVQSAFLIKVRERNVTIPLTHHQHIDMNIWLTVFLSLKVFCIAFRWYGSQSSQSR